ncbi:uncharacterized protein FIBRA_03837 [Fibroporia radiculosa]|uniref:Uncharacterized protein n=1 Tax=Fibroporia radiculosa TaxID=599839 RepID=J4GNP9_9APHY|nr:uncharacterized protein FIBRA_03837 [Fibroporia radiculosa]CCM01770.1 predicted protein [Fibroporia radiculosa]
MASVDPTASPAPSNHSATGAEGSEYPEQKHAGAVGLGPEYGRGATTGDKLQGFQEQIKGKILRKPDVAQHGKDLRTGELKRRQQQEDDDNLFEKSQQEKEQNERDSTSPAPESDDNKSTAQPPRVSDSSHPTERGQYEQAASVAPEGSERAANEQPGEHAYHNID